MQVCAYMCVSWHMYIGQRTTPWSPSTFVWVLGAGLPGFGLPGLHSKGLYPVSHLPSPIS